jgi:hypothetical protein
VRALHPEYAPSDPVSVGPDAAIEQQLRKGELVLRLGVGGAIRGMVVDPEGQPVAGASVLVGDMYVSNAKKLQTQADGGFEVSGCARGKVTITAEANGFAATAVLAEVGAPDPVRIVLSAGKPFLVKVVDRAGSPVAGADVWVNTARAALGLMPEGSPRFRVLGKTDSNGLAAFANIPRTEAEYGASAPMHIGPCGLRVRPDESEVAITLSPALVVSGTVKDAATGQPVPKFRIVTGRPEPEGPYWSTIDRFNPSFEGGSFRHVYEEAVVCETNNSGYLLKFEAEGYLPFVTRFIAPDEGEVSMAIALQPSSSRLITILNPDGSPAAWTDVGLPDLARGNSLPLVPGGFNDYSRTDGALLKADQQGRIKLAATDSIKRLIAANSAGYGEFDAEGLADGAALRLAPWGRIEGCLTNADQTIPREVDFAFHGGLADEGIVADILSGFHIKPDASGHFVLPMVPPGQHHLRERFPNSDGHSWSYGRSVAVEVRAGQTAWVAFETNAAPALAEEAAH